MRSDDELIAALQLSPGALQTALSEVEAMVLRFNRRGARIVFALLSLGLAAALSASFSALVSALAGAALFAAFWLAERPLLAGMVRPLLAEFQSADWTQGVHFISPGSGLVRLYGQGLLSTHGHLRSGARQVRVAYDERRHELTATRGRGRSATTITVSLPEALSRSQGHWLASYFGRRWALSPP